MLFGTRPTEHYHIHEVDVYIGMYRTEQAFLRKMPRIDSNFVMYNIIVKDRTSVSPKHLDFTQIEDP